MNIEIIAVVVFAILVLGIILKFLKKIIKTIAIIVTIIALVVYIIFFADLSKSIKTEADNSKFNISIFELQKKYCFENMSYRDSIKCNMIIMPIYNDIVNTHTKEQVEELKTNKIKMLFAMRKSVKLKKVEIQESLKKINALHVWNDFAKELKENNFLEDSIKSE